MAKPKPVLHIELENASGHSIGSNEEVELSDKQLDWLAEFFTPIVKKGLQEKGA